MIEIRYAKSQAGLDNIFDLLYINDYIPMPLAEQHNEGTELKFYLSFFQRFNMLGIPETGVTFFWNTYFTCQFNEYVFKMIYDHEYDTVSFAVDKKFIEQRQFIAGSLKSLIEKEGLNTKINPRCKMIDLNSNLL